MHAVTVLAGIYGDNALRVSVHPEPSADFLRHDFLEKQSPKKISTHRDAQGLLRCNRAGFRFSYEPPTGNFHLQTPAKVGFEGRLQTGKFDRAEFVLRMQGTDRVYGFGAATGAFEQSGQSFRLCNLDTLFYSIPESSYSSFPFFLIRRGQSFVGVFLCLAHTARADLNQNAGESVLSIEPDIDPGDTIDFDFFVFSGSLPEILLSYSDATGRPFLPPLWALGYHQSRWSYKTQERVIEIAQGFRSHDFPCDAIYLDIHYMDRYRIFTFHPKRFPNPEQMHAQLAEMGLHTVSIVDPGVSVAEDYALYKEGLDRDLFCKDSTGAVFTGKVWPGKTVFPDFTLEGVRDWWADKHAPLFAAGVSGIWNDMNEPVLRVGKSSDPLREDIRHAHHSHREVRNLYANYEAIATADAFEKSETNLRPFILTRSAFCGIQKHAALWTGDNHSSWEHLRENLRMVMNLGLSGVPFAGADIGGFASSLPGALHVVKLFRKRELFQRWIELGSLMPFCRVHSALLTHSQEPWTYGGEQLALIRKHIRRRYQLMPYLYSLFWHSHRTGAPVVRPLFYDYPETEEKYCDDSFMLGPDLFAAPVLHRKQRERTFYLPPGEWYEFETGKRFLGGQTYTEATPVGYYPLFVRGGTVLPMCKPGRNAIESVESGVILEIYPSTKMEGRLLLDDFTSPAALAGDYFELQIEGTRNRQGHVELSGRVARRKYASPLKKLELRLPVDYRTMTYRTREHKGIALELAQEDRLITKSVFQLGLGNFKASFEYRSNWPQ